MHIPDLQDETDVELVRAFVRDKDRDALDVLLRRHESRVYGLAYRITGNRPDALDVTQEVLLTVFRKVSAFKGESAFTTWLYRLTTNACYDLGRRKSRSPVPAELVEPPEASREDRIERSDEKMVIEQALAQLIEEQRAAVVMRDIMGLSYEEIAEATEAPLGTVKSRIARGRAALAALLGADTPADAPGLPGSGGEPPPARGRLTEGESDGSS